MVRIEAYECTACGYIFDPTDAGSKFVELAVGWVCPLCGMGKDVFVRVG